jgi:hypothetical protein
MGFVQIIAYSTSKPAEMQAATDEWEKATEGRRKVLRRVLCEDRDNWGRYFNIVFFESHEAAMENSALPETGALSAKLRALADGPPTFYNLDVADDRE